MDAAVGLVLTETDGIFTTKAVAKVALPPCSSFRMHVKLL